MGRSPLDHPRLAIIDKKLDAEELDEAQHLLAQLGDNYFFRHATTYLASRLLYLRGTLDQEGLTERLGRLLDESQEFPEAEALLLSAKAGTLQRPGAARSSRPPPVGVGSRPPNAEIELAFGRGARAEGLEPESPTSSALRHPEFPKPARVPALASSSRPDRSGSIPDLEISGRSAPAPGFPSRGAEARDKPREPEQPIELTERSPSRIPEMNAGARYSSVPEATERIALSRRERPQISSPAEQRRPFVGRGRTEGIVTSDIPASEGRAASLFDVAAMLDSGRLDEALAALASRGDPDEPDHALLKGRVLSRGGQRADALAVARRLAGAPLLDPTVRAGVARLALELDDIDLALEQAERAHEEDPLQPTIRLTFAWAALRRARRTADPELVSSASLALRELVGDGGPHEGLLLGLRACVEAHAGDAVRALRLAERSIELEPSADGYAALAMAAARLGRTEDARRASARLRDKSAKEAAALTESLEAHGDGLFSLRAHAVSIAAPAGDAELEASSLWGPLEHAVIEGRVADAWNTFAQLATDTLSQVSDTTRREPPALAAVAASFLTVAPISRDLAPYDQTPRSLICIADLLSLLAPGAPLIEVGHPLAVLVGAYVGETLRQSLGARWRGNPAEPQNAEVFGEKGAYRPFEMVAEELAGEHRFAAASVVSELESEATGRVLHLPAVTPICPWDPAEWPAPSRLPHYALAVERSIISALCRERNGEILDGSLASLHALDDHIDRIAPRGEAPHSDTRWARRVTVLGGAYLGEVLRRELAADWSRRDGTELGPESYRLLRRGAPNLQPVQHVFLRVTANAPSLHTYALDALGR